MSSGEDGERDADPLVIPITGDLDLHPFLPAEIPSVVEDYVRACRERGILRLRLAHGRGRGVQRAAVRRRLASMREVVAFADAPPAVGGWGATVVELRPREERERKRGSGSGSRS
jgi:DNA-nicking Smr family endonuclease